MYKLYLAPGACSRVPLISLIEAGVDFDLGLIRFMTAAQKQPGYLALNPKGKVPCLLTPEGPITENVAIAGYLAARHPGLMPKSATPYEQAMLTADLAFCASTLHPIVSRMRVPMFMAEGAEAVASVKARATEAMHPMAAVVEARLTGKSWWHGENWSIMDAYIYWVYFRITGGDFPVTAYPSWVDHARRMELRPAVRRALALEAELQSSLEAEGLAPKLG